MKNVIVSISLILVSFNSFAAEKCQDAAVKAVKATYGVTSRDRTEVSSTKKGSSYSRNLGMSLTKFTVNLDVNGGSGVYEVAADSSSCLITKVELLQID